MNLPNYLNIIRLNVIRRKLFRNEAELTLFSDRKFKLPEIPVINQNLLDEFRKNYPLRFYNNTDELQIIINELRKIENQEAVLSAAEKIMQNIFSLQGKKDVHLGDMIRWNYDYQSGYQWENEIVWRQDYFQNPKGVDLNRVWQIGRLDQCILLAKAFLIDPDEKYALKFLSLINEFNEGNTFCRGVNWLNTAEVSKRTLNITFALSFFIDSPVLQPDDINKINEMLLLHSVFIENNLNYSSKRDSGYLISQLALAVIGLVFQNTGYGKKMQHSSFSNMEREIRIQINDDGTSYEQSVPYHSVILETLYLAKIIFQKAGMKVSHKYDELLNNMFIAQNIYLRSDNSVPRIGEVVTGRILNFDLPASEPDYSYPLPAGAFLYKDPELKSRLVKGSAGLLFLFGSDALINYRKISALSENKEVESASFPKGKHYIFRSKDMHLFIEAGETGIAGMNSGGHTDVFTFDLFYKGKNFISDPGSFSAYSDKELHRKLRSIKLHNTIFIDDEQLAPVNGKSDNVYDISKPEVKEWYTDSIEEIFTAEHYGYARLTDPVIHRRSFVFNKEKNLVKIKDELLGGAKHQANLNIHFHPSVNLSAVKYNEYTAENSGVRIKIKFHCSSDNFLVAAADSIYSEYDYIIPARKISVVLKDKFPAFILTEIELL